MGMQRVKLSQLSSMFVWSWPKQEWGEGEVQNVGSVFLPSRLWALNLTCNKAVCVCTAVPMVATEAKILNARTQAGVGDGKCCVLSVVPCEQRTESTDDTPQIHFCPWITPCFLKVQLLSSGTGWVSSGPRVWAAPCGQVAAPAPWHKRAEQWKENRGCLCRQQKETETGHTKT